MPVSIISSTIEIARHEFNCILRTRRAMIIAGLYIGSALLGAFIFVIFLRFLEKVALEKLLGQGADAALAVEQLRPAFADWVSWFAGADPETLADSLRDSVILSAFFWTSPFVVPWLVVLTSFDQLASDLESRSLCYTTLKAPRLAILLGKNLAYGVLFVVLSGIGALILVTMAAAMLDHVSVADSMLGILRAWILLMPIGIVYVTMTSFASVTARTPFNALMVSLMVVVGLGVLGLMGSIPEDTSLSFLRTLRYLSPGHYKPGLWMAGVAGPLTSVACLSLFSCFFLGLAAWRLQGRDL